MVLLKLLNLASGPSMVQLKVEDQTDNYKNAMITLRSSFDQVLNAEWEHSSATFPYYQPLCLGLKCRPAVD